MIIKMEMGTDEKNIKRVEAKINELGYEVGEIHGTTRTVIGIKGDVSELNEDTFIPLPGVEEVIRISKPYKLASLEYKTLLNGGTPVYTRVSVDGIEIGGDKLVIMAGPCAIETKQQIMDAAKSIDRIFQEQEHIARPILRGGADKPRSSPYSFQGLGEEGLEYLAEAGERYKMPTVTEVVSTEKVELVSKYVKILQVGARNMDNFELLKSIGQSGKPVLLKRGMAATVDDLLQSAEYILDNGNSNVILCLRGTKSFDSGKNGPYRNNPDAAYAVALRKLTPLPTGFDPSHSTGARYAVKGVAIGAVSMGADFLLVEAHPNPEKALCDGSQSLHMEELRELVNAANDFRGLYNHHFNGKD
ncbi:3-deoxy-7-phosphoheptulonate synthase [Candidatus Woesearchaeota archaeon]|nr:3-deoxy-7-phosphoheptulonate synthase [Candidatus Woesearchaeota archaeon]|tara:strand:+ start:286 stop:1365 length:1080 start_codon:yes stop_codon:yes gene_type:complete